MNARTDMQEAKLQPPKPDRYRLPTLVQPNWRPRDLLAVLEGDPREELAALLCARYGVRHCLLLERARSGLYLLIRAARIGGEWILPSFMHRPSVVLLRQQLAEIAFADIDPYFCIDPASVERLITRNTRAILATHSYGKAADLPALRKLADAHGIMLIENAVHMAGGQKIRGRTVGGLGDTALLSFNVDKPLGAILGGALLTNDDALWGSLSTFPLEYASIRETRERIFTTYAAYRFKPWLLRLPFMRSHRAAVDGAAEVEAFSAAHYRKYTPHRIHPLQAAVALQCLRREDRLLQRRAENAEQLRRGLVDLEELDLPLHEPERPHCYTYFPIILREGSRFRLGERLARAGIETKWRYYPLHLQADFANIRRDAMERTEILWRQHLLLPAGAKTSTQDIDHLVEAVRRALRA